MKVCDNCKGDDPNIELSIGKINNEWHNDPARDFHYCNYTCLMQGVIRDRLIYQPKESIIEVVEKLDSQRQEVLRGNRPKGN